MCTNKVLPRYQRTKKVSAHFQNLLAYLKLDSFIQANTVLGFNETHRHNSNTSMLQTIADRNVYLPSAPQSLSRAASDSFMTQLVVEKSFRVASNTDQVDAIAVPMVIWQVVAKMCASRTYRLAIW